MKVNTKSSPATGATKNIVSLKRFLRCTDNEEDDFVLESSMQPKRIKTTSVLAKDLEISTTQEEILTTTVLEGENKGSDKSLMVVENRERLSLASEVTPKCSRVNGAKVPHDVGFFIISRSDAGPSNIASQPPHFMDSITSTPQNYNEPHRAAGATLRILQEVEKLLLPRFIKDREEKLYREDEILKSFHEGISHLIQSCNDRFLREEKLLDEKVVSLQGWINRLQSEMETLQNERQNSFETTKEFQKCARAIMQLVPKPTPSEDSEDFEESGSIVEHNEEGSITFRNEAPINDRVSQRSLIGEGCASLDKESKGVVNVSQNSSVEDGGASLNKQA